MKERPLNARASVHAVEWAFSYNQKNTMKDKMKKSYTILNEVKNAIRNPYTFPGCYPLSIITDDGGVICPDCAKKNWRLVAGDTLQGYRGAGWFAVAVEVLWEGGHHCDNCGECVDAYPGDQ